MGIDFKGEGRILIIPEIRHIGGFSVNSHETTIINQVDDPIIIGNAIIKTMKFIKKCPPSTSTPNERNSNPVWKENSKYKSEKSFTKNNYRIHFMKKDDGSYIIDSEKKSDSYWRGYNGSIKKITLTKKTTAEEIGKAIIDVFKAAEDYYKENPFNDDKVYQIQTIELLNGSNMIVQEPKDEHFINSQDYGSAEIYQGYSYMTGENEESSAEFFIGIASELDCNLDIENVKNIWEEQNGRADFFEFKNVNFGIFNIRAEFKNKKVHKTSYLLQMEEDLLLECSMEVYMPNRRKKLDEKLIKIFDEFSLSCKIKD